VIWGGSTAEGYSGEAWGLALPAGGTPAWTKFPLGGAAPTPRVGHSTVYDAAGRRMIVFAGLDNELQDGSILAGDAWSLDLSTALPSAWMSIAPAGAGPSFRASHMAVYDGVNRQMVVFGGWDNDEGIPTGELWTLSLSGPAAWRKLSPPAPLPGPRQEGTAIFDPQRARMILFGGGIDEFITPTDETWALGL